MPRHTRMDTEDISSVEETLEILTSPGETDAIREGLVDAEAGKFADSEEITKRYLG